MKQIIKTVKLASFIHFCSVQLRHKVALCAEGHTSSYSEGSKSNGPALPPPPMYCCPLRCPQPAVDLELGLNGLVVLTVPPAPLLLFSLKDTAFYFLAALAKSTRPKALLGILPDQVLRQHTLPLALGA